MGIRRRETKSAREGRGRTDWGGGGRGREENGAGQGWRESVRRGRGKIGKERNSTRAFEINQSARHACAHRSPLTPDPRPYPRTLQAVPIAQRGARDEMRR
eukprot:3346138-Rhodomonas_salina.1